MSTESALRYLRCKYDTTEPSNLGALIELGRMSKAGVELTNTLVDYVMDRFANSMEELPVPAPTWVYFLRSSERVKIGCSNNPVRRARDLSLTASHVIATMPGGISEERALHDRFASHRVPGTEWFEWCDEIAEFVESLAA